MKVKKIVFLLIITGVAVVCFIIGWQIKNVQCEDIILYDYAVKIDSLKKMEFFREDEQLPYYGMKKEDVLTMLPSPLINYTRTLFDSDSLMNLFWLYNRYKERLKGTQDTIIVDTYAWEIPYHDRPDLFIVFEKKDTSWITAICVQWNSKIVFID